MATQRGIEGLLRVIEAEAGEALVRVASGDRNELDALVRSLQDDVERLRQAMDVFLATQEARG